MFTITVVSSGTQSTTRGTLSNREIFVGRSRKCELVLMDLTVSAVHCRLVAIEGGVIVLDEGSTNGTWLNDAPVIGPTWVAPEDELRIGPYTLTVRSLVGGSHQADPQGRAGSPRRLALPSPAARPLTHEPPTPAQISQAQVFWRILGFQQSATREEAFAAYLGLAEQYSPERVARLRPELRAEAELRLREVEFAWEYLQRLFRHSGEQEAA